MRTRSAGWAGVVLTAMIVVTGCSDDKTAEMMGGVTVDGKPIEDGSIAFSSVDGSTPTAGGKITGGRYAVKVPVGTVKVEIRSPKVLGEKKLYDTPDSPVKPILGEALPARYNRDSELRYDVKPGKNEKDWELKGK